ncbi:hypothetical protein M0R45_025454 [Rubus argutus]|uniref:Reverse transcriptase Ty1/copia-type domain-containing protein n=1 Tax=Rubus argutus TaxID=59490 RepID=A0AAW1WWI3_RUBAR
MGRCFGGRKSNRRSRGARTESTGRFPVHGSLRNGGEVRRMVARGGAPAQLYPFADSKITVTTPAAASTLSQSSVQPYITRTQSNVQQPVLVPHTPSVSTAHSSGQVSISANSSIAASPDPSVNISCDPSHTESVLNTGDFVDPTCDNNQSEHISSSSDSSNLSQDVFASSVHTSIQFDENEGSLHVNSEPGIGISVVLNCAPTRPTSQISEANVLHPVEGIANIVVNEHSMLTRGKRGISQKKCFLAITSSSDDSCTEPYNYKSALKIPEWKQAMQEEYDALMKQKTWTLVALPPEKNLVSCKWIFKIKRNADGSVARHKARLVARGFSQEYGVDYDETFSPVVRHTTVRLILSLAASSGWSLHQLDVKNAFLHGTLHEEVYMTQPSGFEDAIFPSYVCKLEKSLYGLKQAPRAWNDRFTTFLPTIGFHSSHVDPSLFVKFSGSSRVYLLLYVDDIILTGDNATLIEEVKLALQTEFDMKDLGQLHYFLGLEINYLSHGLFVSQHKYAVDLIHKAGLDACHSHLTPSQSGLKLYSDIGDPLSASDAS